MKGFVVVVCFVWAVSGVPVNNEENLRIKKSPGTELKLTAPCAGGAPLAPIALYLSAAEASNIRHYRDTEHEEDTQNHARSYYGAPGAAIATGAHAIDSAAPAIGLFPNAHIGGCAIPLLLSCSPSVHSGHLATSAYSTPAAAYRADGAQGKMAVDKQWTKGKMSNDLWNEEKTAEKHWTGEKAAEKQRAGEQMDNEKQRAEENMIPEMQWTDAKMAPEKEWESERAMELLPVDLETKPVPTRPFAPFEPELRF